ncbi:ABC transporter substrate-binding protein [Chloroflexota bacterium]
MNTRRKLYYVLVSVLVVSILLAGCSTPQQPTEEAVSEEAAAPEAEEEEAAAPEAEEEVAEEEAEGEANVFVYATTTSWPDIDPAISFSDDSQITSNCYETLTVYNTPGSEDVLAPGLAESWESAEDDTVWTFHLQEGVTFHNGDPLNAEAVKGAIENTIEIGAGAAYIWAPVDSIEAVDEYTVQFNLSYPAPLDLVASAGYAAWIYNPATYAEKGTEWFNEGNCAGTGPYTIESYDRGSRLIMTRYEDYWGGWSEGQFDKVVFEVVEDPVVRQQMVEAGTADFTYEIPPDNLAALEARDDVVVYKNPSFQNMLGLINTQKPPLDDPLVRQALSYSFPYQQMIEGVMGNLATQAHGPIPAGMWGHSDDLQQYSFDLDKAGELLAEAGYPEGGFDLLYTFNTGDLSEQTAGEIWKAELAKLGINLEVQGMSWESQWDLGMSDPQNAQDVFVMYWWPDYVSPVSWLYGMFRTEEETLFNLGYYSNETVDELIDTGDATSGSDREEATKLFIEAQEILVEDAAAIFFYDLANTHVARTDVNGFADNPAYPHVVFVYNLSR